MKLYHRYLQRLYRGGRPNSFANIQNRASAIAFGMGIWPSRAASLELRGRHSGRRISVPVVIADYDGERYLVSMLGENSNWVRNLRAADGRAVLRHGRSEDLRCEEVAVQSRAAILRQYLAVAPGARPHIPVDRHASLGEFERIAPEFPVFRLAPAVTASSSDG